MKYTMLVESVDYNEIKSQPFFHQFNDLRLYHGSKKSLDEPTIIPFRFRENPVDTPKEIHDKINEKSQEKFGLPVRNLKFTYSKQIQVYAYGDPFILVPKGEFRLFVNPNVYDMTVDTDLDVYNSKFYEQIFNSIIDNISELQMNMENEDDIDVDLDFWLNKLNENYRTHIPKYKDEGSLSEMMLAYIMDVLNEHVNNSSVLNTFNEYIPKIVKSSINMRYNKFAEDYIENLQELTSDSDIDYKEIEFMLYAPEGMYIIPENTKLYNMLHKG